MSSLLKRVSPKITAKDRQFEDLLRFASNLFKRQPSSQAKAKSKIVSNPHK